MSAEELKRALTTLSAGEQNEVSAFLFHLQHRADPAYQGTVESRISDKDPSHWLTPEEFEKRLDESSRAWPITRFTWGDQASSLILPLAGKMPACPTGRMPVPRRPTLPNESQDRQSRSRE
jgi:hypothetical protein